MSIKAKSRSISFITLTLSFTLGFLPEQSNSVSKTMYVKIASDDNITIEFNVEVVKNFCYFVKEVDLFLGFVWCVYISQNKRRILNGCIKKKMNLPLICYLF